jgi:hypothetical protein
MKKGKTLQELSAEILRQANSRKDYTAATTAMNLDDGGRFHLGTQLEFGVRDLAHRQIAEFTGIPAKYYDQMRTRTPALLAENVNTWFRETPAPRLARTLDGSLRAFLSNAYRPLDNFDLAEAVFPVLEELDLNVVSADITDTRLYVKAVHKSIEREVPKGAAMGDGSHHIFDTVAPAVFIGNSEVGGGSLYIEKGTLTKACTNLALIPSKGMRKYHVGGKTLLDSDEIRVMLSDETKAATDKAVFMQVQDILKSAFEESEFDKLVNIVKDTAERKIDAGLSEIIEVVGVKYGMTTGAKSSVLRHLAEGGSLTQYGLANAVTRAAEDEDSYDTASAFEKAGGEIMLLSNTEWKDLGKVAKSRVKVDA